MKISQEQLQLLYLLSEEYSVRGQPAFLDFYGKLQSDFELVDLLDYLPNPSNVKISKSSVGLYDVYSLLPTYLIGYNLRKLSAIFADTVRTDPQNETQNEVLKVDVDNTSVFFEHHTASNLEEHAKTTKRGVAIKFAIENASVRSPSRFSARIPDGPILFSFDPDRDQSVRDSHQEKG